MVCPRQESNLHGPFSPAGLEPTASTNPPLGQKCCELRPPTGAIVASEVERVSEKGAWGRSQHLARVCANVKIYEHAATKTHPTNYVNAAAQRHPQTTSRCPMSHLQGSGGCLLRRASREGVALATASCRALLGRACGPRNRQLGCLCESLVDPSDGESRMPIVESSCSASQRRHGSGSARRRSLARVTSARFSAV